MLRAHSVADEYQLGDHDFPPFPAQASPVLGRGLAVVPCSYGQHLSPGWGTGHRLLAPPGQPAYQDTSLCPEAPGLNRVVDGERVSGLQLPDGIQHPGRRWRGRGTTGRCPAGSVAGESPPVPVHARARACGGSRNRTESCPASDLKKGLPLLAFISVRV